MRKPRRALGLLALASIVHGDNLPYNPTRIVLPPNSSFAYIFGPSTESNNQAQLSAVDISGSIATSGYKASTISRNLPFLQSNKLLPYAPTLDPTGNITVVAGECDEKASDAKVWQFQPALDSSTAQGTWRQRSTTYKEGADVTGYAGLGYLANSIAFSDSVEKDGADMGIYIFGGMCPFENSTADTWISRAEYSNSMLTISPDSSSDYDISLVASRGPPIQQAGSSITPLTPTYSVDDSGHAQTQQQDFVLLGGNTEIAFINMSQVALFSLPQQSWSFVDVIQPTSTKTDLAIRQGSQNVTPRSGHTAVLSESGDSIILFGGWVGDVNTPAQPQLAILELGAGYGGSGDWQWTIPEQSGSGLEAGAGIYGHGAAMLPGGVLMVVGGYEISSSPSKRLKRSSQTANNQLFLYNTTSQKWVDSYTAPEKAKSGSGGPLSSTPAKVGLGTGLGIGAALLLTMVGFYLWYGKRLKSAQEDRERALLSYSSDGSAMGQVEQPFLGGGMDGRGGDRSALGRSWPGSTQPDDGYARPLPTPHATGAYVNVPSPTRGLRKGSAGKNQYHSASRSDDKRVKRGSGIIHPIAEHDDEDGQQHLTDDVPGSVFSNTAMRLKEMDRMSHSQDPFTDNGPNPLGSHPISAVTNGTVRRVPTNASKLSPPPHASNPQEMTTANWTIEDATPGMTFEEQDHGFSLINGDDRTSSTLSERSQYSSASTNSITRTMSTKTGAWLAAAAAAQRAGGSLQRSSTYEHSNALCTNTTSRPNNKARSRTLSSSHGSFAEDDGDPFIGARPTSTQLQADGETLMKCRSAMDPDDPYQRAIAAQSPTKRNMQQSMFTSGAAPSVTPRRRPGLMGSLRRALHVVSLGDRSVSLNAASDPYEDGSRSTSSSPTKDHTSRASNVPRRAVSDGGALLAQKRGQKDWDPDAWPPYRDDPDAGDWGEPNEPKSSTEMRQAEEEWDVETAAVNRDFQVMFTVPKSKLRVVNDDMDRASLLSASDGGVSRSGSVRREGSVKALKVRTDGANLRLPSTEEELDDLEKDKAA